MIPSEQEKKYEIKPVHDILYVDMRGSWSPEETVEYVSEFKRLVSRYFAREWACVLNLKHLDMLISETQQISAFKALNTWAYIKGMKSLAVIVGQDNRSHLLFQFEEILKGEQSFYKSVFHNEVEANHWLTDQGFSEKVLLQSQKTA